MTKIILIVLGSKYGRKDRRNRRTTIPGILSSEDQVHETKVNKEAILKKEIQDSYFITFTRVYTPCESCIVGETGVGWDKKRKIKAIKMSLFKKL